MKTTIGELSGTLTKFLTLCQSALEWSYLEIEKVCFRGARGFER